jgi:3-isopropylmalate dehydrogenase
VTSVDKANVLEVSRLWRSVVAEVAARHPAVRLDHVYVDACAMRIALAPASFDVILTENLFGDILSDEAGAICGSLGLLPSACLGDGPGLYEPVHGSAPDIAGRDLANPIGAIGSAAMLLRHSLKLETEARDVERAIEQTLRDGHRTADLAGTGSAALSCTAMTEAIIDRLGRS